MKTHRELHE